MKLSYLFFVLGLLLTSCSGDKAGVGSSSKSQLKNTLSISSVETAKINQKASSSSSHQLSLEEINLLYEQGLISQMEKEELIKLANQK